MSSAAQVAANRANATHSTGPVTEAGKSASSRNATRHGLTGKQIVIPGEEAEEYDALRIDLYESYEPASAAEKLLIDQICACAWLLQRAQKMEAAVFTRVTRKEGDSSKQLAYTFAEEPEVLLRLQRYMAGFERAYYKAIKELQILQKSRAKKQEEIAKQQPDPLVMTWAASQRDIGFVSPNPTTTATEDAAEQPASHLAETSLTASS